MGVAVTSTPIKHVNHLFADFCWLSRGAGNDIPRDADLLASGVHPIPSNRNFRLQLCPFVAVPAHHTGFSLGHRHRFLHAFRFHHSVFHCPWESFFLRVIEGADVHVQCDPESSAEFVDLSSSDAILNTFMSPLHECDATM